MRNKQVLLASRPKGQVQESDFRLVESETQAPREGQVLARVLYLSLDPYMRGRMDDARSYAQPQPVGEVMVGGEHDQVVAHTQLRQQRVDGSDLHARPPEFHDDGLEVVERSVPNEHVPAGRRGSDDEGSCLDSIGDDGMVEGRQLVFSFDVDHVGADRLGPRLPDRQGTARPRAGLQLLARVLPLRWELAIWDALTPLSGA